MATVVVVVVVAVVVVVVADVPQLAEHAKLALVIGQLLVQPTLLLHTIGVPRHAADDVKMEFVWIPLLHEYEELPPPPLLAHRFGTAH